MRLGSQTGANGKPLLSVIDGKARFPPPVWLMRQAGRYLPEYRALRAKASSFLDFCYTPALAAEATLQPVRRFGFDAAILFSDILVIPDALGQKVDFAPGEGPRLDPVSTCDDFARLKPQLDLSRLSPVLETIAKVKGALPRHVALIGFCGAPWTVACYMVGGQSVPDHNAARPMAYRKPELFRRLIDRLTEVSLTFLPGSSKRVRISSRSSIPGRACCPLQSSSAGALRQQRLLSRDCGGATRPPA